MMSVGLSGGWMRSVAIWLGLLVWFAWGSVALAIEGTVRLKNGGFIHGDVLEHLPGERVSVRTSDGSVRNIPWEEVERVEEGAASEPAAAQSTFEQFPTEPVAAPVTPVPLPASPAWSTESSPPSDSGEERFDDVTLTLFGLLGVLGNASLDAKLSFTAADGTPVTESDSGDRDLALSYGGGAQLDVPLHRHFSVAPQIRLTAWRPDLAENDRNALFLDFLVAPRLRFPVVLGEGSIGVPYVQVPLGISYVDLPNGGQQANLSVSPAFAVGISGGFLALLSKHVGLALELGWLSRSFSVDYDIETGGAPAIIALESDWSVTQVTLQLGLTIAF
jgi:hypothetical protein